MPDPPPTSLLTRFVLENPYPLGVVLLCLAGGLIWRGASSGQRQERPLIGAVGLGLAGIAVLVLGRLTVTAGEQARAVTKALVEAATAGDLPAARAWVAPDARLTFGAATNPGYARAAIDRRLQRLEGRYLIADNDITMLKAYTTGPETALVHLACRTTLASGYGPSFTQWVLEVRRQPDGSFQVKHIRWVSFNGRSPVPDLGR